MSSGVNFTPDAANRIVAAVRKIERTARDMAGDRNIGPQVGTKFWAYLSSPGDIGGRYWSWVRVKPADNLPTASGLVTLDNPPLWTLTDPPVAGFENAREVNGNQQVPPGSVVELTFIGYDSDGGPVYVFQYNLLQLQNQLPIHDHRDNVTGLGFAFAVYHPGTALPQQPWAI